MISYTVWSEAGGIGKTTHTVNLAAAHARNGQSVLTIDMDPQDGGLTHHFGAEDQRKDPDVDNLVRHLVERPKGDFDDLVRTVEDGIDLVSSHNMLSDLEQNLSRAAKMEESMNDANYRWPKEKQLRRVLGDANIPEKYDAVIVDPPATVGHHLYNAVYATSNLLIPAELSPKGKQSVDGLRDVVDGIEDTLGDLEIGVLGVVPNKVSDTNLQQEYENRLADQDLPVAPVSIRERGSMLSAAWEAQVSVFRLAEDDEYRDLRDYERQTLDKFDELAAYITRQFASPEVEA